MLVKVFESTSIHCFFLFKLYELITKKILSAFVSLSYSLNLLVNEMEFPFTNSILNKKWNASSDLTSFHARKRIWIGVPTVQIYDFFGPFGLTTEKRQVGVFLKFFPDSLNRERPWAFTFFGSLNPRDRITNYTFMSF